MENEVLPTACFSLPPTVVGNPTQNVEVHFVIRMVVDPATTSMSEGTAIPPAPITTQEYVHMFSGRISEANKRGVESLAYWRNGYRAQKAYILNQALAQYLAQYPESQRPVPSDER